MGRSLDRVAMARILGESRVSASQSRHPLRALADRLPPYRRRRTGLFNWLYARHHGGRFLLRIEDTDKARSTQPAIDAILDGMRWLGLDWDGEAYSSRIRAPARRGGAAHARRGQAYRCY
jgi:hypothetical protein